MRTGLNTGMGSRGSQLPPRLSQLLARTGKGYAAGGAVPQPGMTPPGAMAQGMPQGQQVSGVDLQNTVKQTMAANPQIAQQIQQAVQQAIESGQLSPEQLNLAIEMAKAVVQNPALYPRLRQMLIEKGIASEEELPPQYDQGVIFAFLLMAEAVQGQSQLAAPPGGTPAQMAEGGSIPHSASPTGDRSGKADDIPIKVSGGEYVIPKHVVAAKGTEFFDRMLEQYDPNNPESKVNKPK